MDDGLIDAGGVRCHVVIDGHRAVSPRFVFRGYDEEIHGRFVGPHLDSEGKLRGRFACLLIEAPEGPVLVDAGVGRFAPELDAGHTLERLDELGVAPTEVRAVVITHGHADHVGGLIDANDSPVFTEARHLVHIREASFWTSPEALGLPGGAGVPAAKALQALADASLLDMLEGGARVARGVDIEEAPGHTPGHLAVIVNGALLWAGDSIVSQLNVPHPEWVSAADMDGEQNERTRRELLARAAEENLVLAGAHLPVVGRVARDGEAFALDTAI